MAPVKWPSLCKIMILIYFEVSQNKYHYHQEIPYCEKKQTLVEYSQDIFQPAIRLLMHTALARKYFFSLTLGLLKK